MFEQSLYDVSQQTFSVCTKLKATNNFRILNRGSHQTNHALLQHKWKNSMIFNENLSKYVNTDICPICTPSISILMRNFNNLHNWPKSIA